VTAGGTREPIDSVRFIGNRSSGRMGFALAERAARRGADVTLIAANATLPAPAGVRLVEVETAAEMQQACESEFEGSDVVLMAAAVSDFKPAAPATTKLKKEEGVPAPIELAATDDVISGLAERKRPGQLLIGFAAEHGDGALAYGREKLERKRLDAVVVNDISAPGIGFDAPDNEVTIVTVDGSERHVERGLKGQIADAVLDEVEQLRRPDGGERHDGAGRTGVRSAAGV
jgi:phosphopantothenoylcysteine decarboxylase/phosphopantothenate--cysteine ligase